MLFNSLDFAIFLPVIFALHWFLFNKNKKAQNILLLAASYFFYGWWEWRLLLLIAASSLLDFWVGIGLSKTTDRRKRTLLLTTSIIANLGCLGFFKYYHFFLDNFIQAFSLMGISINPLGLNVILPIGISFYTFQTQGYTMDVYKGKLEPTKDLISFLVFVSFFPQLVAGPIERASNLLPQFCKVRIFDYDQSRDGARQILLGLFKKIVIADNCAPYVQEVFGNYSQYSGSTLLLGVFLFSFQIYADFSGYSDIAIGTARLFGFNLMRNFAYPYFSRNISEFWRRWHISLSTWFRDYVYIPLGGSRSGRVKTAVNIFVVFTLSGLWHGASWTFIVWGAVNAALFLAFVAINKNRKHPDTIAKGRLYPTLKEFTQIGTTFLLVCLTLIFFRAAFIYDAGLYLSLIFSRSLFSLPEIQILPTLFLVLLLMLAEWLQREKQHALEFNEVMFPRIVRCPLYYGMIWAMLFFGGNQTEFLYFQF